MTESKIQNPKSKIAFIAPFGLAPKATVPARALPLATALVGRGYRVQLIVPPYDDPAAPAAGRRRVIDGVEVVEIPRPPPWPGAGGVGWTGGVGGGAPAGHPGPIPPVKPQS